MLYYLLPSLMNASSSNAKSVEETYRIKQGNVDMKFTILKEDINSLLYRILVDRTSKNVIEALKFLYGFIISFDSTESW